MTAIKNLPLKIQHNLGINKHLTHAHNKRLHIVELQKKYFRSQNNVPENSPRPDVSKLNIDRRIFIKNVINNLTSNVKVKNYNPKNVVIDFSSPNIAKPFHYGHLRSTIIGNFIANINRRCNNNVTKINYLGDWGTQFGLLKYGLEENNIDINDLRKDPLHKLYEVYVHANQKASNDEQIMQKARQYFADIEQGKDDLTYWKAIRNITIKELEYIYQRLGIKFDSYHWESDYNGNTIKDVINLLENKNIIESDNTGKKIAKVNNRNVVVLKSDESTLYLTRDIAALLDKYNKYKFDEMLYVVDNSQTDHFVALFNIVKQIDERITNGCKHIKFGRIKGMSSRKGNVVFLNDILDEAKEKMYLQQQKSKNTRITAINEQTCDILGTTAVIINDLKQKRNKDYIFEWEKALQSEGDSGIKLQYLHCRLYSLEQRCGLTVPQICDPDYIPEEIVDVVINEIAQFDNILQRALVDYEACIVVNYLFRLARHVNRMFNELKVKNVNHDTATQRLLVFHVARIVIKTGLEVLGIKPLEEMYFYVVLLCFFILFKSRRYKVVLLGVNTLQFLNIFIFSNEYSL